MQQSKRLSLDSLALYLMRRKLVPLEHLVHPAFRVESRTRRCRNFKVFYPNGSGLFIKQPADTWDTNRVATVRLEAKFLRTVAASSHFKPLQKSLPRFIHFDEENTVLVSKLVRPSASLSKYCLNLGNIIFPESIAVLFGRILADIHEHAIPAFQDGTMNFIGSGKDFFSQAWLSQSDKKLASSANREFFQLVRQELPLPNLVRRMEAAWAGSEDFTHGDVRWENILITTDGPQRLRTYLMDWETASRGDAALDVACFLGEYIRFWLDVATITSVVDSYSDAKARSRFPLAATHRSARAFWESYCRRRRFSDEAKEDLFERVLAYMPHAILTFAYEKVVRQDFVPGISHAALQMTHALLDAPEARMREWIGIEIAHD